MRLFPFYLLCGAILSAPCQAMMLAKEGTPQAVIFLPKQATSAEEKAAEELRYFLHEITSGEFVIKKSEALEEGANTGAIYLGTVDHLKERFPSLKGDMPDSIIVQSTDDHLILSGGSPRAVLYAVYEFLQKEIGCDWFSSTVSSIPKKPTLEIPNTSLSYTPPFFYRDVYAKDIVSSSRFSAQMRRNGGTGENPGDQVLPEEWGSSLQIAGHVHTFDKFLPASEYFKDHPEWGSMINGQRISWDQTRGQLCLTNRELLAKMTTVIFEQIERYPQAKIISLSMNDNTYRCECPECLAVEKEEGALSGPMIRFVNAIAREVGGKRPDLLIETLAYFYTIEPPKVTKPEKNVIIRLTSYTDDHHLPFRDNAVFSKKVKSWAALSDNLFIWDYQPDFHEAWKPRPNILQTGDNIRYVRENHARGFFMEAEERPTDFTDLRTWLTCQLLWSPNQKDEQLIQHFLRGYYGEAADSLFAYLKLMHDTLPREETLMSGFGRSRLPYPAKALQRADALFDTALAKVSGDPELTKRVEKERLSLTYMMLLRYPELASDAERAMLFPTPEAAVAAANAFPSMVEKTGTPLKQPAGFGINPHDAAESAAFLKERLVSVPATAGERFKEKGTLVFSAIEWALYGYGTSVTLVADATAPTRIAARMPAVAESWSIQLDTLPAMAGKRWKIFVKVRADGNADCRLAVGAYSRSKYLTKFQRPFTLSPRAEYQTLALGEVDLEMDDYLFLTPTLPAIPNGAIYVSQIILVPVEEAEKVVKADGKK